MKRWMLLLTLFASPALAAETVCDDGQDNDADSMMDCADADCAKATNCQPSGTAENSDALCSDWVDNDGNGQMDCDDVACFGAGITACLGSFDRKAGTPAPAISRPKATATPAIEASKPETSSTPSEASLKAKDNDGERNDLLCSDGVDNDGDGAIDCADYGCRFDPTVTICQGSPSMRFSIVGNLAQSIDFEDDVIDTRFTKLQLRSFGPIPLIQNSFYLVSMRAEKTPRLTFALFQVPLGGGHYLNLNSGGGGLSNALVVSTAKQLLGDPAYYLYSAFEQGNGAAAELGGPIPFLPAGRFNYRLFAAGGSGRFSGNIGGRYFTYENTNYTYSVGGQLAANLVGFTSRWDSPFLLSPSPTAIAVRLGAKYDQRAQERYPAVNVGLSARHGRFVFMAEDYYKQELNFGSTQNAYNITVGALLLKKKLMAAADFGQFQASDFENPPDQLQTDLRKIRDETQWRAALHYYFRGNIGLLSLIYSDHYLAANEAGKDDEREHRLKLVAQYRF